MKGENQGVTLFPPRRRRVVLGRAVVLAVAAAFPASLGEEGVPLRFLAGGGGVGSGDDGSRGVLLQYPSEAGQIQGVQPVSVFASLGPTREARARSVLSLGEFGKGSSERVARLSGVAVDVCVWCAVSVRSVEP